MEQQQQAAEVASPPSSPSPPSSTIRWGTTPIDLTSARRTKGKDVSFITFDENKYGAWGRVCKETLLSWAHLLVTISRQSQEEGSA